MVGSPSSSPAYRIYRKSLPLSIDHTSAEQEREFLRRSYEMSHHRSLRMDFSPEVSFVEATEIGSRTRQGAPLRNRHSIGNRWVDSHSNPRDGMMDRSMSLTLPREENESRVFRHSPIADSDSSICVWSLSDRLGIFVSNESSSIHTYLSLHSSSPEFDLYVPGTDVSFSDVCSVIQSYLGPFNC